jgi:hypothetical protein
VIGPLVEVPGLEAYRQRHSGLDNVEFRLGEIEHLPVADATASMW